MILKHVDLCSGIGGFALGFDWAKLSKPVLFCDIEPWSRQILKKHWPDVPIATDVKELANDPNGLIPDCDILTAGYPCQPFSQAGKRRGSEDDRHIWPHIFSIVKTKRPSWCVFENVYGHVTLGLNEVLSDLERESYATRPFVVPACATDAPHRRDRLWIICRNVADTDNARDRTPECSTDQIGQKVKQGQKEQPQSKSSRSSQDVGDTKNERCEEWSDVEREGAENKQEQRLGFRGKPSGSGQDVAYTSSTRLQGREQLRENEKQTETRRKGSDGSASKRSNDARRKANFWFSEPRMGGMVNGISTWLDEPRDTPRVSTEVPNRAKRLKGLGNAIIPQIAMRIGQTIKEVM